MTARRARRPAKPPECLECGREATLVQSQRIYPKRPDLWNRPMWACECGAYAGCHAGTERAKGRPAGQKTRTARQAAHAVFDRLWQAKATRTGMSASKARKAGYVWLAAALGIDGKACHIGFMDAATAWRVVNICRQFKPRVGAPTLGRSAR